MSEGNIQCACPAGMRGDGRLCRKPGWSIIDQTPPPALAPPFLLVDHAADRLLMIDSTKGAVFQLPLRGDGRWSALPMHNYLPSAATIDGFITAAVLDPIGHRVIALTGHNDPGGPYTVSPTALWSLDLEGQDGWQQRADNLPAPVFDSRLFVDTEGRLPRLLILDTDAGDLWGAPLDALAQWSLMKSNHYPSSFGSSTMAWAYVPTVRTIVGIAFAKADLPESEVWWVSADGGDWEPIPLPKEVTSPPAEQEGVLIFDSTKNRLLLWAGENVTATWTNFYGTSALWSYDLKNGPTEGWTKIYGAIPAPETGLWFWPSGDLDCHENRLIALSGAQRGVFAIHPDPPIEWEIISRDRTDGIPDLNNSSLTYDPTQNQVIGYGGEEADVSDMGYFPTTYALDLGSNAPWVSRGARGVSPGVRAGAAMTTDSMGLAFLFGGSPHGDAAVYASDGQSGREPQFNWWQVKTEGAGPVARVGAFMGYDTAGRRLVIAGGQNVSDKTVWLLSLPDFHPPSVPPAWAAAQWTSVTSVGAPDFFVGLDYQASLASGEAGVTGQGNVAVVGDGAVLDPVNQDLVVFSSATNHLKVDAFNLTTLGWRSLADRPVQPGEAPVPGARIAYDPSRHRAIAIGPAPNDPIYAFGLDSPQSWQRLCPAGSPPIALEFPSVVSISDGILAVGGNNSSGLTWKLDYDTPGCQ